MALISSDVFSPDVNLEYMSDTGVVLPSTGDILSRMREEFTSNGMFGGDFDTTPETVGGRLVEGATRLMTEVLGLCAVHCNQLNVEYALGEYLDIHGRFYGLSRKPATATAVTCTLYGEANLRIRAGASVKDANGLEFALGSDVTLNADGIATATFLCTETGPKEVAAHSVRTISDSASYGWDAVDNESPGTPGADVESDDAFRKRILACRKSGVGFVKAIYKAIVDVPDVRECLVYENCNGTAKYISPDGKAYDWDAEKFKDGNYVALKPHSVIIVVDCPDGDAVLDAVAEAVYRTKSCGCGMTPIYTISTAPDNEYEKSIHIPTPKKADGEKEDPDTYNAYVKRRNHFDALVNVNYELTFNKPILKKVKVRLEVHRGYFIGSDAELVENVKAAVYKYANGEAKNVDGLRIGTTVLAFELASAVSDVIPSIKIAKAKVAEDVETAVFSDRVDVRLMEKADIASIEVTVVQ